ncbi:MAG: DUF368 domain-containing protein [Kiritimatiellia bacterium]|nr:DUF368 domain-containing protein [Kiritimatiellia bacterium]
MISLFHGMIIGVANIIPGVSGGTLALVLGIYERLLRALAQWSQPVFLRSLLNALRFRRGAWAALPQRLREADQFFLLRIGVGALVAIAAVSRLMAVVLRLYPTQAYAFFFGLVVFSMIFPFRELRRRSFREALSFLLAAAATAVLILSISDDRQIAKAERKQALRAERLVSADSVPMESASDPTLIVSFDHPGIRALGFLFLAAALAISAMILPGISGSFVLLLLGVYFDVLLAINERQILVLATFGAGALIGLFVFSAGLSALLRRAYDATLAAMIGLMAGSLVALWPFRKVVEVGTETLRLGPLWPDFWGRPEWIATGWAVLGGGVIFLSCLMDRRGPRS